MRREPSSAALDALDAGLRAGRAARALARRSSRPKAKKPVARRLQPRPRRCRRREHGTGATPTPRAPAAYRCHTASDAPTMHTTPAVVLGCADCHGGNPAVTAADAALARATRPIVAARDRAHVLPRYPKSWHYPSSGQPAAQLHPAQPRVAGVRPLRQPVRLPRRARELRRLPHRDHRGGRALADGDRRDVLGRRGLQQRHPAVQELHRSARPIRATASRRRSSSPGIAARHGDRRSRRRAARSPSSIRCRPGRWSRRATSSACSSAAAATSAPNSPRSACPTPTGEIQRLEEPGRPDLRQSNRGPGTGLRVAIPVLNIHKTRLNDPFTWFMGTNDQPGDYRHSGCAGCHVVYANDREPQHSLTYAQYGRDGQTHVDPASIPTHPTDRRESGHPIAARLHPRDPDRPVHELPHAPAEHVPEQLPRLHDVGLRSRRAVDVARSEQTISDRRAEIREGAGPQPRRRRAARQVGRPRFPAQRLRPQPASSKDTQFADYHGHGWNFRAVFKRDREGNLLDADGNDRLARRSGEVAQGRRGPVRPARRSIPARRST